MRSDGSKRVYGLDRWLWSIPVGMRFVSRDSAARWILRKFRINVLVDDETGCWRWPLATNNRGQGVIWWRGSVHGAHRWLFMETAQRTYLGKDIVHKLNTTMKTSKVLKKSSKAVSGTTTNRFHYHDCVRPAHYEAVTRSERNRRVVSARGYVPAKLRGLV